MDNRLASLEEIFLSIEISASTSTLHPAQWTDVEDLLRESSSATQYPHLQRLQVRVKQEVYKFSGFGGSGPPGANEAADRLKHEWEALFTEGYTWCRENLDFTFDVSTPFHIIE
jgi:hypothetical protein